MTGLTGCLWWDGVDPGAADLGDGPLPGRTDADVAIVGAGYTGLWTAHYLLEADPTLRVVLIDAEHAGAGASGRNGGWCSALFPASLDSLAALPGSSRSAALDLDRAMRHSVQEVGRAAAAAGIEAELATGGTIALARNPAQVSRAQAEISHARSWGLGAGQVAWWSRDQTDQRLLASRTLGATYTPDCAALHPGRLVRGLAGQVRRQGARLHDRTRATAIEPGRVLTDRGDLRAEIVIRATEGYTPSLARQKRRVVPLHSLIVATEPLPSSIWEQIGLRRRETFTDHRHLVVYGQRTADDRLVFGGRGAPYQFGSGTDRSHDERVFGGLRDAVRDLFPMLDTVGFTHAWGGVLGISRDWCASVALDRRTGLGWAGGYVGDGVATTNLAGRTLRDLILGEPTDLTALPWVGHRSRSWEPEPLRWLGVTAGLRATQLADAEEARTGRPSRVARLLEPFLG